MIFSTFDNANGQTVVFSVHRTIEHGRKAIKKSFKLYKNLQLWHGEDGLVKIHDIIDDVINQKIIRIVDDLKI